MPDAAITTDIIVGFPGETEEDFLETMRVVEASRFTSAFTFQYSPRPGTPAFDREPLPKDVVQERFERLLALQDEISLQDAQAQEGRVGRAAGARRRRTQGQGRRRAAQWPRARQPPGALWRARGCGGAPAGRHGDREDLARRAVSPDRGRPRCRLGVRGAPHARGRRVGRGRPTPTTSTTRAARPAPGGPVGLGLPR